MKRTSLILMGALALIAVFAFPLSSAWKASTATYWENLQWHADQSDPVQATTNYGWVRVNAPSADVNCQVRYARALTFWGDIVPNTETRCPEGTDQGTAECCQHKQWSPTQGASYKAQAWQTPLTSQDCGPTYGQMSEIEYECMPTAPGE